MRLRLVVLLVGIVAAWVGLVAAVNYHASLWHWIEVHTGTVNEGGPYYGFFSGFGSDIGELAIIGGVITVVRRHNCHQKGCWRLGVHTTGKGHLLCKKHVGQSNDALDVHPVHADHL